MVRLLDPTPLAVCCTLPACVRREWRGHSESDASELWPRHHWVDICYRGVWLPAKCCCQPFSLLRLLLWLLRASALSASVLFLPKRPNRSAHRAFLRTRRRRSVGSELTLHHCGARG